MAIADYDPSDVNAAIFPEDDLAGITSAQWDRTLATNLRAPVLLTQALAAALPAGSEGAVVNVTDWRTARPYRDHFSYTVAKGGLMYEASVKGQKFSYKPKAR